MKNKQAHVATAAGVEGRERAQGNAGQHPRVRTPGRTALSRALDRVRQAAQASAMRVTALWPPVDSLDRWREAEDRRNHEAAPGVDGPTWAAYGEQLASNVRDLADRRTRGAAQAPPVEKGVAQVHSGQPSPGLMAVPARRRSGAAGTHGAMA